MAERIVGRAPSRSRQVGLDMVRSMGLVTLALLGVLWLELPHTPDPVRGVDWRPVAQTAAQAASYPVLAPKATFAWTATSARVEPQDDGTLVWRVGFLSPDGRYAALLQRGVLPTQAHRSRDDWVAQETRNGQPEGTARIAGRRWARLVGDPSPDDRRAVVLTSQGTTTIVTGSATWSELELLAASLRVVPR